jgi:hypothetical protein
MVHAGNNYASVPEGAGRLLPATGGADRQKHFQHVAQPARRRPVAQTSEINIGAWHKCNTVGTGAWHKCNTVGTGAWHKCNTVGTGALRRGQAICCLLLEEPTAINTSNMWQNLPDADLWLKLRKWRRRPLDGCSTAEDATLGSRGIWSLGTIWFRKAWLPVRS